MTTASLRAMGLTCEYQTNPLGVDTLNPRLSWKLASDGRGQKQTAFQILVSRTREDLGAGRGDLWDTGKVEGDQSIHVVYDGPALTSRLRCWWKVRVWDKDGRPSAYSEPAWWEMGLLKPEDWQGKWISNTQDRITDPEAYKPRPAPHFRKVFAVGKPVVSARAYICGLGFYELFLNGQRVGDHALDPTFTRYDRRVLYVTHDVTDLLQPNRNAVGVVLRNGWFNELEAGWEFDRAPWRAYPRMRMQLHVAYSDGTQEVVVSDESWQTATGPILFDGLRNGEVYDARLEQPGWNTAEFDDSAWRPAVPVDGPAGCLSAQMCPPIKITQTVKPVGLTEPKCGVFVFDMGQNMAGWARLKTRGPAGARVTLTYGEALGKDGLVDQSKLGGRTGRAPFQRDTYVLKGAGEESWEPCSGYHGFQYVQVEGLAEKPSLDSVEGQFVHTAFAPAGSFECSHDLVNRIQRNAVWGFPGNFHGMPTDCPHREKNGWTGDAHLASETGLMNFETASAYTKWMQDFADCQQESGEFPAIVPTGGWGFKWGNGPAWDSAFILICWYLYLYRGDRHILEQHFESMKRYVDFLTRTKTGALPVIRWGLGDWLPPSGVADDYRASVRMTSTSFYYADAMILARIAALLGREDDEEKYRAIAGRVADTLNKEYFNPETGIYAGGSQTEQSCALHQGFVEPRFAKQVARKLVAEMKKHDGRFNTGMFGTKWLLRCLAETGHADVAFKAVSQTKHPSWGWQIAHGATTFWEHWNGEGSHNHPPFTSVSEWFYRTLAGIAPDPEQPGFKHITIDPRPVAGVTWVRAEHESMYGTIRSAWRVEKGRLTLEVGIPPNSTATVHVPTTDAQGVGENGQTLEDAGGVEIVKRGKNAVVLNVGSGVYRFDSPYAR